MLKSYVANGSLRCVRPLALLAISRELYVKRCITPITRRRDLVTKYTDLPTLLVNEELIAQIDTIIKLTNKYYELLNDLNRNVRTGT